MIKYGNIIPYYYQIKADILDRIRRGELHENEKIESENELARKYGVSRPTVRQALNELVFTNVLWRRQGRGTFVSPKRLNENLLLYSPFVEEVTAMGKKPTIKITDRKVVTASKEMARLLEIEEGDEVLELAGLRLADEEPISFRSSYYPMKQFPDLIHERFEDVSLFEKMQSYGVQCARAKQTFQVVLARENEAHQLKISVGFPLLLWEGIIYSNLEKPFELTRALYRSDKYQFQIEQFRNNIIGAGITGKTN